MLPPPLCFQKNLRKSNNANNLLSDVGYHLLFANNRNRVRWTILCLSQDGACIDLFENHSENSLKPDLSNDTIVSPPLFSLVNAFKFSYWTTSFDVINDANLETYSESVECYFVNDVLPPLICCIPQRPMQAWALPWFLQAQDDVSYFPSCQEVTWHLCDFLDAICSSFPILLFFHCSNPGLASLSCTVKTKLPWHTGPFVFFTLFVTVLPLVYKKCKIFFTNVLTSIFHIPLFSQVQRRP